MTTSYTHRVTIAAPESMMPEANHLACIMGESSADIETFKQASYQDAQGNLYAVCSTVVTDTFMQAQSEGLPPTPAHAEGVADPALAQAAYDSLNAEGGLMMVVNDNPQAAIEQMGLEAIKQEGVV